MAIQLGGLVSGFDTESLITALIQKETAPLQLMANKQSRLQETQNAWRDVNTRLTNLRNTINVLKNSETFTSRIVSSSNDKVLSASAGALAANGTYQLKIDQIAEYNRYATLSASVLLDDPEATASTALHFTGGFTIRSADSTEDGVVMVEYGDSLRDIAIKINAENCGVTASIVENRLSIRSNTMGEGGAIVLSASEVLDSDHLNIFQTTAAQDAKIIYEGLEFTRSNNYITDLISGVTLNLTGTSDGGYVFFTVSPDTDRAAQAVQDFVDQYNSLFSFLEENTYVKPADRIDPRASYDVYSAYDSNRQRGILQGDPTVIGLQSQLRRMVSASINGFSPLLNSLSTIGVSTTYGGDGQKQYGYLSFNADKLIQALSDPVGPATITATGQMPVQFNTVASKSATDIITAITGAEPGTTPSNTTPLGLSGVLEIQVGDGKITRVLIDATYSLNEIRNKINAAGAGVTASVSDGQLLLTSNTMGVPGKVSFSSTNDTVNGLIQQISVLNTGINDAIIASVDYTDLMANRDGLLDKLMAYGDFTVNALANDQVEISLGTETYIDTSNNVSAFTNDHVIALIDDFANQIKGLNDDISNANSNIALYAPGEPLDNPALYDAALLAKEGFLAQRAELIEKIQVYGPVVVDDTLGDDQIALKVFNIEVLDAANNVDVTGLTSAYMDSVNPAMLTGFTETALVSDAGYAIKEGAGGSFTMEISGRYYYIELEGPMTSSDVVKKINSVIGSTALASLDKNNRLTFTTLDMGVSATITIKDIWEDAPGSMSALGLVSGTTSRGKDLDAFFTADIPAGQPALNSKQPLGLNPITGSGGNLRLNIDGYDYTIEFVGNYNIGDIANKINSVIGGVGQAYIDENNFLVIRSLSTSSNASVRVVSFDNNLAGLNLTVGQSGYTSKALQGIAVTLDNFYAAWVVSGGILAQKQNSLGGQISDIQKQIDNLNARIDKRIDFLWQQFTNMEKKLSDLNSQSQYVDTYLSALLSSSSKNSGY